MNILLINTNRFKDPPAIPLAIETLHCALTNKGFDVTVLDLCFVENPIKEIEDFINSHRPDAVCLSVRNVDSGVFPLSEFYLPEVKTFVDKMRSLTSAPIIVGGSAVTAAPQGILNFLKPDIVIEGPGEATLPEILNDKKLLAMKGRIIQGKLPESFAVRRKGIVNYQQYVKAGGIAGFETHKGCSNHCPSCVEANTRVRFKDHQDVLLELKDLVDLNLTHLHLCDSEFNEDLDYSVALLEKMVNEHLPLKWSLYLKTGNYSSRLFELLKQSGVYSTTLCIESQMRDEKYWRAVKEMISLIKSVGIRIVADLLLGLPGEDENTYQWHIDFLLRNSPDEVVFNPYFRLYEKSAASRIIINDPVLRQKVFYPLGKDETLLAPAFYCGIDLEKLKAAIGNNPLFKIIGDKKGVDYQQG